MARMRDGSTTDDYRIALSGEGEFGSLGYEWVDKPHRLVYDLCGEIDHLRALLNERDDFICKKGLFEEFVNTLPPPKINPNPTKGKSTKGKFRI